jgi:hypothetical protein
MREPSVVAANHGRGARLAALFLGLVPLTGLLAACGGGGGDGGDDDASGDMLVERVTPTNGQETLANLSDPDLNGRLTMVLSGIPTASSIIDPQNAVNLLTPNVQILDQSFTRVRGTPAVDAATRTVTFTPAGGSLAPAQYTVTMSKFVSSTSGKLLNNGLEDFSSSWTVGPDVYPPVVRNVSPANNQNDVPLFTPIVVTFNESLEPASVVFGQTVFVQDGGTNPPTQLSGTLQLKRNGFDLVFTPDPCVGLPPSTTVVFRMLGAGNVSFLRDPVGNPLVGDPNNSNEVQFQFNTKGVKPLPIAANMHTPGSPRTSLLTPMLAYVTSRDRVYAFDVSAVAFERALFGRMDVSLVQQVLETNRQPIQTSPTTWGYGPLYGGDYEAKLGQCGEAILDARLDPATGDTYYYMIDEANESVAIVHSATGRIEGHFNGIGTPKGIAMTSPFSAGSTPILFVTNYGQATLTGIDIGPIQPGLPICTAIQELQDDQSRRLYMPTGRNPAGVAAYWGNAAIPAAGLVNQSDGEFQIFDPRTLAPIGSSFLGVLSDTYSVGENPIDIAWSPYFAASGWIFAYVVNQGGIQNPTGSVSVWWNATTGFAPFNSRSGTIATTITDGMNVPGRVTSNPGVLGNSFYVPNTGGDEIVGVNLGQVGGYIYTTITATVGSTRPVGDNPTGISWTGLLNADVAIVPLPGLGVVGAYGLDSTITPPVYFSLPGARYTFAWQSQ